MIVSLHVATGAAAGALARNRRAAVVAGPMLHLLGDWMPHQDMSSFRYELGSGLAILAAVAFRDGPFTPATLGAAAACAPDLEHAVRLPRPGGRKLFPSHRWRGWHRAGGVPAHAQALAAGLLLGVVLAARRR